MALIEDLALTQLILTRYILAVCFIMGIVGCFLNIIVFYQKKLRTSSCSVYFIATSIFNLLVILFGMTPVFLASYLPSDPSSYSSAFCKARSYTTHAFLMMSRTSVALTCVDRFALCSRHVRIRSLNQRHIAVALIIVTSILWLIVPIHFIVYIDTQTLGRCGSAGVYQIVYTAYAGIVTSIPLVIMIVFSVWTFQSVRQARVRVHPILGAATGNIHSQIRIKPRDIQLLIIVTSEVVVYLLSTVWFPIHSIYAAVTSDISKTSNRLAVEGFVRYLALSFLVFLNSCSIFYVHLLASKTFRQEFQKVLLLVFKHNRNNPDFQANPQIPGQRQQMNHSHTRRHKNTAPNNM